MNSSRIGTIEYKTAAVDSQKLWDEQVRDHGRMTNMKMTLARSSEAFKALMSWYPLKNEAAKFLGERRTILFAHAISSQSDCLICSTFFRRILTQWGENPDSPKLDSQDEAVIALGRAIAKDANAVSDAVYERTRAFINDDQMVTLIGFAGIMVATNIVNNVLRVPLDDYLSSFKKE